MQVLVHPDQEGAGAGGDASWQPGMRCAAAHAALLHTPALNKPCDFGRCAACTDPAHRERNAALVGLRCAACGGAVPPWQPLRPGLCSLHRLPRGLPGGGACRGCGRRMAPGEQVGRSRPYHHPVSFCRFYFPT